MTVLTAAVVASLLTADPSPDPSRFYFHEAVGLGGWFASSSYKDGTRDIQALSLGVVSTVAFRPSPSMAIGGQLQFNFSPFLNVTQNRSRGGPFHQLPGVPWALSGLMGPSLTLFPGNFRFDISPGFLWVVTGPEAGQRTAAFGGTGAGVSGAAGYDLNLNDRLALCLELRATTGLHVNSDSTHIIGWDLGVAFLAGVRRR